MINKEALNKRVALIVFSFITFLSILKPLFRVTSKVYLDYNEGWQAHFSKLLAQGEPLYQPLNSLFLNWYPPLSFYLPTFLGGDYIIAGRFISLFSLLMVALFIALIVYKVTQENFSPIFSSLLFLSFQGLFHTEYFAMNDPQWFAHAVMMGGFTLFIYKKDNLPFLILSIFIMITAGFIKHLLIPIPIAITLRLFFRERVVFVKWIIISITFLITAMVLSYLAYGSDFFIDLFRAPRTYNVGTIARIAEWLSPHFISITFSTLLIFSTLKHRADNLMVLLYLYLGIAFVWGAYTSGSGGVYYNSLFDFIIVLTIITSISLAKFDIYLNLYNRNSKLIVAILLFLPIIFHLPFKLYETKEYLLSLKDQQESVTSDVNFLKKFDDPVLVENLALSYWAEKQLAYTPVNMKEKIESGFIESSAVTDLIENKYFSVIQLDRLPTENYCFTGDVLNSIEQYYRKIKIKNSNLIWYIPKRSKLYDYLFYHFFYFFALRFAIIHFLVLNGKNHSCIYSIYISYYFEGVLGCPMLKLQELL